MCPQPRRPKNRPSYEFPVGAVLGVGLVPVGPREHAEPAGVAVLALPSVGRAILVMSEHAAAFDADAVVGVPSPYDRRHAAASGLYLALAAHWQQTDLWPGDNPPPSASTHGRGSVALTAVASTFEAYDSIRALPSAPMAVLYTAYIVGRCPLVRLLPTVSRPRTNGQTTYEWRDIDPSTGARHRTPRVPAPSRPAGAARALDDRRAGLPRARGRPPS